jgi:hypothetical protein
VFLLAIAGRLGIYIWLSNAAACAIAAVIAIIFGGIFGGRAHESPKSDTDYRFSVVGSVISAGTTLYRICVIMLLFAVGIRVLEFVGVMQRLPQFAYAFAEITNIMSLNAAPALLAVLTSFGGLCVIFQTAAITRGRLKLRKFLLARIPIAAISGGICYIIVPEITPEALETAAHGTVVLASASGNPIASVCLLIMTLILLSGRRNLEPLGGDSLER